MKTEAIKAILSALQEYAGPLEEQEEEVLVALAELAALEAEYIVLGKALGWLTEAAEVYEADQSYCDDERSGLVQPITKAEGQELFDALANARAILSDEPTGKVLVDVEKLREIEWFQLSPRDIDGNRECPCCYHYPEDGHAPDCWLAALLKEKA